MEEKGVRVLETIGKCGPSDVHETALLALTIRKGEDGLTE
jgi:hypothetical protein